MLNNRAFFNASLAAFADGARMWEIEGIRIEFIKKNAWLADGFAGCFGRPIRLKRRRFEWPRSAPLITAERDGYVEQAEVGGPMNADEMKNPYRENADEARPNNESRLPEQRLVSFG